MIYLITFCIVFCAVLITYWIATEYPEPLKIDADVPVMVVEFPEPRLIDKIEIVPRKGGFDIR